MLPGIAWSERFYLGLHGVRDVTWSERCYQGLHGARGVLRLVEWEVFCAMPTSTI